MADDEKHTDGARGNEVELFRLFVESAEDYAIFTTDLERRVNSWNSGAERLLGWSEAEVIGQSADLLFTPEDRKKGEPEREFEEAYARGRADNKRWHLRKDGSRFRGDGSTLLLVDDAGNARGFARILRDRTDERRAVEACREADRRKDEFLAMLAHELRNPLAATGHACRLSLQPEVDEKTLHCAKEVIARQVQNLSHLIDDLLDVSRINLGKIQLRKEPLHVGAIIARAVEAVSHLVEEKNHDLNVSVVTEPMRVHADPTRLEQIVSNLLINAAKFTDTEGSIIVTAYPEPGRVIIKVEDNGIGLSSEVLTEVFELFFQVNSSLDRTQGGLGIGLSVVKKLVELHGGSVRASSKGLGEGSEFAVHLPSLK